MVVPVHIYLTIVQQYVFGKDLGIISVEKKKKERKKKQLCMLLFGEERDQPREKKKIQQYCCVCFMDLSQSSIRTCSLQAVINNAVYGL